MSKVFFNGEQITTPATRSAVNDTAMYAVGGGAGNVAALVGRAAGGKPCTVLWFKSPDEARSVLKGDDITLKAIEKMFNPSSETSSPSKIGFVRVNPATQAAGVMKDAANQAAINLRSTDYGRPNNQIKYKVESGSITGKKLSTQFGNDYYSQDNIARQALSVRYAGADATATIAVGEAVVTLVSGASTVALDLNDFPTVQELVDRINTVPGFNATVLDNNGPKPALKGLDFVTATDCKGATVTITGHLQACVDWFNSTAEGFLDATRATGAGAVPANAPFTYLNGASDGVVTNAEWQAALDALKKVDVQWLGALSPLPAIHAMVETHVEFMSNTAEKFRRAFVGPDSGTSDADAMTAARVINSQRVGMPHLGIYDYNSQNKLTLYPPYVTAALLAGMAAGLPPGTPLTAKSINAQGIERALAKPTDTDPLIDSGVLSIEDDNGIPKVVQSITTYTATTETNRTEVSVGAGADFTRSTVNAAIDPVRGKKLSPLLLQDALSRAETALKGLAVAEPVGPGVLVGDADNPPYRKLRGSIVGTAIKIQYEASIAQPANYVLQELSLTQFSGSASA